MWKSCCLWVCVCVCVWLCRVKLWWCSIKQPVRNQKLSSSKFGKRMIKFLNLKTWVISRSIEFKITSKFEEVKNIWTYLTALPCASLFDDWWWDIMGCMMDSCLKVMVIYCYNLNTEKNTSQIGKIYFKGF